MGDTKKFWKKPKEFVKRRKGVKCRMKISGERERERENKIDQNVKREKERVHWVREKKRG